MYVYLFCNSLINLRWFWCRTCRVPKKYSAVFNSIFVNNPRFSFFSYYSRFQLTILTSRLQLTCFLNPIRFFCHPSICPLRTCSLGVHDRCHVRLLPNIWRKDRKDIDSLLSLSTLRFGDILYTDETVFKFRFRVPLQIQHTIISWKDFLRNTWRAIYNVARKPKCQQAEKVGKFQWSFSSIVTRKKTFVTMIADVYGIHVQWEYEKTIKGCLRERDD